jgi:ParB-like chromosome segregation protein Spo0J
MSASEVSTGKENAVKEEETKDLGIVRVEKKIDQDSFLVTVDQLDTTVFKNPRSKILQEKVLEYRQSLKDVGQLQNLIVAPLESGKYAVVAGYTRTEAFWQLVCDKLIRDYNNENNFTPTSEGALSVANPDHRKIVIEKYPEEFEKLKNKERHMVYVRVDESIKTASQARMKSFSENYFRENMSISDEIKTIEQFIEVDGMSASDVARMMKKNPSIISQKRKVGRLIATLREVLVTPDTGETFTEEELAKLKEKVDMVVSELERRMDLQPSEEDYQKASVSFSHLREFSQRVVFADKETQSAEFKRPLSRRQIFDLTAALVGYDTAKYRFIKDASPENYSVWLGKMKAKEEETKALRSKGTATAETPEVATATTEDGSATGTVADLATAQIQGAAAGEAAAEANADVAVAPAAGAAGTTAATTAATPAAEVSSGKEDEASTASKAAALVGGEIIDDDEDEPLPVDGSTGRKTQVAPIQQARVKEANVILSAINTYKDQAFAEETEEIEQNCGVVAASLQAVAFGYEMLTMETEAKQYRQANVEYCDSLEAYIRGLEDFAEKAVKLSKEGKKVPVFSMDRPFVVDPNAEFVDDDAEDADAPSIDDLQDIDDELFDDIGDDSEVEGLDN